MYGWVYGPDAPLQGLDDYSLSDGRREARTRLQVACDRRRRQQGAVAMVVVASVLLLVRVGGAERPRPGAQLDALLRRCRDRADLMTSSRAQAQRRGKGRVARGGA